MINHKYATDYTDSHRFVFANCIKKIICVKQSVEICAICGKHLYFVANQIF